MLTLDAEWAARTAAIPLGPGGYRVVDVVLANGNIVSDCVLIDGIYLKPPQDAPAFSLADIREVVLAARPKRFLTVSL